MNYLCVQIISHALKSDHQIEQSSWVTASVSDDEIDVIPRSLEIMVLEEQRVLVNFLLQDA
jgi:hypothetical protein